MKTSQVALLPFILFSFNGFSQIEYPHAVLPGQKFNVVTTTDTIWLMKNSQFENAVSKAKLLNITEQQLQLQKALTQNRDSVITQLNGKINVLDTAYNHYKTMWTDCDKNLQNKEIEAVKLKESRKKTGIFAGLGGLIIGFIIGIII